MNDTTTGSDTLRSDMVILKEFEGRQVKDFPLTEQGVLRRCVERIFLALDQGRIRIAEKIDGNWITDPLLKQAVLWYFQLHDNILIRSTVADCNGYDKIPLKFSPTQNSTHLYTSQRFEDESIRIVPGAIVRMSAHIEPNAVLMPCFINVGARIGRGTMLDTFSSIGSCAQVGANCHISQYVGLGGVLEPLNANPVIIEDNCFIGAKCEIDEGVIVREGSVLASGVILSASTKIVDQTTGKIHRGEVPPGSVVVPGTYSDPSSAVALNAAIIVKTVDADTRAKVEINSLLRDA